MVPEDGVAIEKAVRALATDERRRILLVSPDVKQYDILRGHFPRSQFFISDRFAWDLNEPRSWGFDYIFCGNVMHYSPDPPRWFRHLLACCATLLVQDLVTRRRASMPPYLADDGDRVRYSLRSRGVTSSFPGAFDLGQFENRMVSFSAYRSAANEFHEADAAEDPVSFVAVMQGDLQLGMASGTPTPMRLNATRYLALQLARRTAGRAVSLCRGLVS